MRVLTRLLSWLGLGRGTAVLLPAAVDLGVRAKDVADWHARSWLVYALSLLAASGWIALVGALGACWLPRGQKPRIASAALLAALSAVVWAGQLEHYRHLGGLPSDATVYYILGEPHEAWILVLDSTGGLVLAGLSGAWGLFAALWLTALPLNPPRVPKWALWAAPVALFAASGLMIRAGNRFIGDLYPPLNLLGAVVRTSAELIRESDNEQQLRPERRVIPVRLDVTPPVNVLLVVGESLRYDALSRFGGVRRTTPHLDDFLSEFSSRITVFPRFYSNAARTIASYPSILSGVGTGEPMERLQRQPLIFQYGKVFRDTDTFCISAHAYKMRSLEKFLLGTPIDLLYTAESSGEPAFNSVGIDDRLIARRFERWLEQRDAAHGFLGILHFNGTHMPYHVPEEFRVFDSRPRDPINPDSGWDDRSRYDEGVLYFDHNLASVLESLRRRRMLENTAILFTSDHAEAMREHGHVGHTIKQPYFDEVLHIPFWIYLPPELNERFGPALRGNAERNASNVDIVPTVIDLLGLWEEPLVAQTAAGLPGGSLLRPLPAERAILVENWPGSLPVNPGLAILHGNRRFIYHRANSKSPIAWYDLDRDPEERHNLWPELPDGEVELVHSILKSLPSPLHAELLSRLRRRSASMTAKGAGQPANWNAPN
jgi:hypothetical protein